MRFTLDEEDTAALTNQPTSTSDDETTEAPNVTMNAVSTDVADSDDDDEENTVVSPEPEPEAESEPAPEPVKKKRVVKKKKTADDD